MFTYALDECEDYVVLDAYLSIKESGRYGNEKNIKIFEYKNGRFPMVGWRCWHGISLQFTSLMPNPLSHLVATGEQDFDPTEHHLGSIVLSWCRALAFIETNANSLNVIE